MWRDRRVLWRRLSWRTIWRLWRWNKQQDNIFLMKITCNIFIDQQGLTKGIYTCDLYSENAAHEHRSYVDKANSLDSNESVWYSLVIRNWSLLLKFSSWWDLIDKEYSDNNHAYYCIQNTSNELHGIADVHQPFPAHQSCQHEHKGSDRFDEFVSLRSVQCFHLFLDFRLYSQCIVAAIEWRRVLFLLCFKIWYLPNKKIRNSGKFGNIYAKLLDVSSDFLRLALIDDHTLIQKNQFCKHRIE